MCLVILEILVLFGWLMLCFHYSCVKGDIASTVTMAFNRPFLKLILNITNKSQDSLLALKNRFALQQ